MNKKNEKLKNRSPFFLIENHSMETKPLEINTSHDGLFSFLFFFLLFFLSIEKLVIMSRIVGLVDVGSRWINFLGRGVYRWGSAVHTRVELGGVRLLIYYNS